MSAILLLVIIFILDMALLGGVVTKTVFIIVAWLFMLGLFIGFVAFLIGVIL